MVGKGGNVAKNEGDAFAWDETFETVDKHNKFGKCFEVI